VSSRRFYQKKIYKQDSAEQQRISLSSSVKDLLIWLLWMIRSPRAFGLSSLRGIAESFSDCSDLDHSKERKDTDLSRHFL
jgi:hypothetical protein